jgi:hypothetical protein
MGLTTSNVTEPANPAAVAEQTTVGEAPDVTHSVIEEAAQGSERAACASADGLRHATETARDTFQASLNPETQSFQPITNQVTQVLGLNGSDPEDQARRASQNLQAVTQASTVLARGFQEASNEVFRSVQNRLTKNMDGLNRMAGCRSVRAFVAAQSELMRDNVQLMIDTNRRIAALSVRIADEAAGAIQAQDHANQVCREA